MRPTISAIILSVFALATGCGNNMPGTGTDMTAKMDMAGPQPDMVLVFPVPAGCATATAATGTAAYAAISTAASDCMGGSCHNSGQAPTFNNKATFITAVKDQTFSGTFKYVTSGDPDRSYLLYKLSANPQMAPGGGGSQMPLGKTPLNAAQMCTIYQWIKAGAPNN